MSEGSQLKDLSPKHALELSELSTSDSFRQGSYYLKLRRPDKYPVFSRRYQPGDPIKLIDWKAYSRTDQLIIREKQESSSGKILIVIEDSDSMKWPDREVEARLKKKAPTKMEIAARIALNLGYLHFSQGDKPIVTLLKEDGEHLKGRAIPTASPSDFLAIFQQWQKNGFEAETNLTTLPYQYDFSSQWNSVYLISDGLNFDFAKFFPKRKSRKLFVHLLSSLEQDVSWLEDDLSYFDFEVGEREFNGAYLKNQARYAARIERWHEELQAEAGRTGWQYL